MPKKIIFSVSTDVNELAQALYRVDSQSEVGSLLLFSCDENDYALEDVNRLLASLSKPIMGGVFPQILYQDRAYTSGFVLVALKETLTVKSVAHLSSDDVDYETLIDQTFAEVASAPTLFVFVDGLAKRVASLVDGLYANFGTQPKYIGGGAGSLSFVQKPCLYTNQGLLMDAAVIGLSGAQTALGVGHGWKSIVPDWQVTKVDRNLVQEINYKPAFEVYQQAVNQYSATPISRDNFFSVAQSFPFGINKLGGEKIVRDPIAVTPEGYLVCVGELSQGDYVDLLTAQPQDLFDAVHQTALSAQQEGAGKTIKLTLFIDCISRALFLKEAFDDEVAQVRVVTGSEPPLVGALVLGEIANSGSGYLEFYNKTAVVGLL